MAVALAGELGAGVPHGRATLDALEAAMARGMAESDFTLLYRDLARQERRLAVVGRSVKQQRQRVLGTCRVSLLGF